MDGGCACGTVRYRLKSAPLFVHCCHCTWCQRESGSAFAVNALIETSRVDLTADRPEPVPTPSSSGRGQIYLRCSKCHVALWSHYSGAGPKFAFLRVGTLDHPHDVNPDIHIFTSTKRPWVILPEGVPAVPEYYDREKYWPATSLARRAAVIAD
ncbi:MAG: GFA family protein [Hyphomonadaceae bacterium]|nr:GFA family protein [Hyphomonadaceae bacterium]